MSDSHSHHCGDWEERYSSVGRLWSGQPNEWLPSMAAGWPPGAALDIGCGEGADALWLAERGWQVTGIDLSATAVGRLRMEADRRGLGASVTALVQDGVAGLDRGTFDLVTCFYVHGGPDEGDRSLGELLADAAACLAPGGRLLVAVHAVNPPWRAHRARTYSAAELLEEIGPVVAGWEVAAAEECWREAIGPQGQAGRCADAILCLHRPGTA